MYTYVQAHDCGRFVNTAQCNLTSLSRDLTTSGSFEGWPASFEATASNPAAASRLTGDAAAPSARIVATLNHMDGRHVCEHVSCNQSEVAR